MRPRLVGLAVLITMNLAACGVAASPRPPAPLPTGAIALNLHTAPPEANIPENWACAGDTIEPARVARVGDGVVFILQATGQSIDLVWPRGFSAWLQNGHAEVVAPGGTIVLREGDVFSDIISGVPEICEVDGVFYPPVP